ncbi:BPSS1780 family membrane protein [uncultured Desulfobulbus sp.]|uniref:BPSS1780 family membrane protein n=1 Tax=uncultured Desulfobulbus sp. TaxID=239745 RepID=UPI0029C66EDF|nr:BPSS1780 family membrane protein [uncultured Desulfobulbus sp.]
METINVVLTGKLLPGTDFETAAQKLAALTRLDRAKVELLLNAGQPTIVKKSVSPEVGEQYRAALTAIGVAVELQPCQIEPPTIDDSRLELEKNTQERQQEPEQPPPPPPSEIRPPEPVSNTPAMGSRRTEEKQEKRTSASARSDRRDDNAKVFSYTIQPIQVPAAHGWLWIKAAIALFLQAPWRWMGILLVYALVLFPLSMIPYLGSLLSCLVSPVLTGGLMIAAQLQSQDDDFQITTLFQGFSRNRNQLLLIGFFSLLFFFLLGALMFLFVGVGFWGPMMGRDAQQTAAMVGQNLPAMLLGSLVFLLLVTPVIMAFWFAPCLVALEDLPAWDSLKLSLRATLKNWPAFLMYSLVFFLLGVVASILFGVVAGGVGVFSSGNSMTMIFLIILLIPLAGLPAMAVTTLSYYTGFRDIFPSDH